MTEPKALLVAIVGPPGAGKTTWARERQAEAARHGDTIAIVERDAFRDDVGYDWTAPHERRNEWEKAITNAQHGAIAGWLMSGTDVIVADTNLVDAHLDGLRKLARVWGAAFAVQDFTGVPLDECIRRDARRPPYVPGGPCSGRSVGEEVIRAMWEKYTATHTDAREGTA